MTFRIVIFLTLLMLISSQDTLFINPSTSSDVSTITDYQIYYSNNQAITPITGSSLTLTFPSDYQGRLGVTPCTVTIFNFLDGSTPSATCSFSNLVLTINGLFTTGDTYPANSLLWLYIDGIRNPATTQQTGSFSLGMTLNSGPYPVTTDGSYCSAGTMSCSLSTNPASVNQKGKLIVSFTAPEFPIGSTIQIQTSGIVNGIYWDQSRPNPLNGNEIIQSSSLTCQQGANSIAGILCSFVVNGGTSYAITASNLVNTNFIASTIVFSMSTILSPPTTMPQGSFMITSYNNNALMSTCTGIPVVSTTGSISLGAYSTSKMTVNAAGVGTLTFVVNINLDKNDVFIVTFPPTISLASLTSVYINGLSAATPLSISSQNITLTLTGSIIYAGSTITVDFTNIINPPNELTTSAFQIVTYRNGYQVQKSTGNIKFSAYRSTITSATLTSTSNQIGFVSNYTITFTLGQPLISSSAIIIALPSALQGKVVDCQPSCSVSSTIVTFTSVATAVNTLITLKLISVTNPYNLGLTTSLTLYTLYYANQPFSTVEYVNTGLTLTLVARASTNANAVITPSSFVVNNYPTTYTITITNLNPFFPYTYLTLYLPPEITIGGSITCQSGASVQSCNFDSATNMLTFSPFTTSTTAGQLSSSPFMISNLINPASTMSTSSFQVYFYNFNNQIIEYITSGLSIKMTIPAKFSALSLVTNNTVNSALTTLTVTFNVPSLSYQNNTFLVLTFPSVISLTNVLCSPISSNILAINQCLVDANSVKILISYSSLSIFTSTRVSIDPYNNYPSLEPYPIQVDLYGDSFQQSKLCSNINSLINLQNSQLNIIGISSYSFSNPALLLSSSNLLINFANASSTSFKTMTIKFPPDFGLASAGCSAPSQVTCSLVLGSNMFSLTTSSVFSFPFTATLTNILTTAYSPSSYIFVQTFSSTGYQMDSNSDMYFATTCTLPCRTCQSAVQTSICMSCYSNSSLIQVSGAIYLNGTSCSSRCGFGYYQDASLNCLLCSTNCLTCSAFSTCLACNSSYLFNSSCLPTCPFTYYGSNFQCFPCPTDIFCKSCTDNFHCSSCINGYFYYNQQCLSGCPAQITYPNSVNNTCDICPLNCTNCQGNSSLVTCTICDNGYVMDGTRCYLNCVTAGTFPVNGICQGCSSSCLTCAVSYTNCTSCYSNSTIPYLHNNNCITICPSGYYPDNSSFTCVKCTSPCEFCTDSSVNSCQTCITGYFLFGTNCLPSCPANYYNSSKACLKCVSPCFTCTNELSCLSCTNNTYLYQNQCYQQCPAGLAVINGNQCLVCLSSCKTCSTLTTCDSCYNSSYLYNGSCINICPATTFANNSALVCDPCIAPCLACSSLTTCISCVDTTKFLVNGTCIACDSPCRSCSLSTSNCTSCLSISPTPYYLSFSCLPICPSNYFSDNITFQCTLCASPCSSCYGSTNSSCGGCQNGYYLLSGNCYTSCPPTYFNNITVCSQCQPPCLSCSINNHTCTSCTNTNYLKGSQCVPDCGVGMIVINNSICSFCDSICKTCLSVNSSACTSCYSTYYLQGSSCLSSCPNTYYGDNTSNQCLSCITPCLNCQASTICTSCKDSLLFLVNGSCLSCFDPCLTCSGLRTVCTSCNITSAYPYLNNGNCIAACPVTYYVAINFTCLKCNSPCDTCLNESSTFCVTCIANFYLLQSKCLSVCNPGYFANVTICSLCTPPCATCFDTATTCLSCIPNNYLFGSKCVATCDAGMSIINGNICQYCAATCQTCSSSNSSACTSCYNSTYLYGINCVNTCPPTFYSDSTSNRCMVCVGGCNTCQSATFCLTCLDNTLYLVNGSCVGCSNPCVTCSGTTTNCTSCAFSTTFPYLLNNICLATCPANYFNDAVINACTKCTSPCQACTSALTNTCVTCINGYLFLSGSCLPSCPAGYYSNGTICLACLPPCQNCYDSVNCISCTSGNYLTGSQCNTSCATGMIIINNTYCQYCTGLCVTCLTSNSSYCTSCAATQFLQWGACLNTCANTYFGNSTSGNCEKCQSPCGNCISPTICLTCFDVTLFLLNNSCVSCLSPCMTCSVTRNNCTSCDQSSAYPLFVNNLCLNGCPSGYYASLNTCYRCNAPCDTCLTISNATCHTCLTGYVMLNSSGSCLINCPSGFYSNTIYCMPCTNNCSTCSSDSVCLSCPNGLNLLGSACTSSCPNGSISTVNGTSGGICSYCNSPCTSCQTLNTSFCTSCPTNLYLSNGQCVSNCPNGYFANSALWVCAGCVSPCNNCTSPTQCLSCLDPSHFLMNFMCVGCDSKCLTCSSTISNCTSCNNSGTNPYLYGNTCLDGCPSTYYNDSSFVCKPCSSPCYTCTGGGNQSCVTCLVGYYQLGNLCYNICPGGYYSMANQCLPCTAPCSTCTGSSNNSCTACQGGLYLLGSSCVNNCSGLATNGNTCVYCSPSCNTCLTNNNTFCTSCSTGLFLFSGTCITNCSSGYYPDTTSLVCLVCINNCSTCTSATACLTCANPNMFLINSQCVSCNPICLTCSGTINNCLSCNTSSSNSFLFGSTCISSCPSTYYNNTPTTCVQCSSPCSSCSGAGTNACITCLTEYYFYLNSCYSICPTTTFQNLTDCSPCDANCYACQNSAFTCISCKSGLFLRGSACVTNCSIGEVLVNNTYCSVCAGNCLTCQTTNFSYCTSCSTGAYLSAGACLNTCPSQFYGNSSSNLCVACKIPCVTCSSDVACLSCNPSTPFLVNNTCVSCSSPCLACQGIQTNCTSCNTGSYFPFLFGSNCIASCPSSYYNDGSFKCAKCNSPCDTCTSSSNRSCLTCLPGYTQLGTDCYINCPISYYSNGTYCLICDLSICKTCTINNNTCLSCANGLYLSGSLCNSSCPTGMIIYNGSICETCTGGCLTCLTSNNSYCTSCYSANYLYMGGCSPTCLNNFFAESSSGKCLACQSPCLQCLSISTCLSCRNSLEYLQNFTCVSSCTYPLIGINNTCYQCSSQCITCVQTVSTCLLCANGFYYFPATFSCSLFCSFYILRANKSNSGNNQCTQTCPSVTFTDSSSQYCQECPTGCKTCVSSTNCTQCNTGYSFYSYFCYSPCPIAAPYSINSNCVACNIISCQSCLNSTYCSTCQSPYLLFSSGISSSCITSCPAGFTYNLTTTTCVNNSAANTNTTSFSSNIVSSSIPPYTILIATGSLVFLSFIIKFKYAQTSLSLVLFICIVLGSSISLGNILYLQLITSGISKGDFSTATVSTYVVMSSGALQVLSSLGCFIAILKIKDPALTKTFKAYPFTVATLMALSVLDSNLLLLTISQFMAYDCFTIKYSSDSMQKLFKFSLSISIITKCLNVAYSGLQLNYLGRHAARLLVQTVGYPINNSYTNQLIVISCVAILIIIYLLYGMTQNDKIDNSKNDSNQSLIDDAHAFDKRNSSNSQLIFEVQSSDLIVDINSIKDENDITLGSETKRFKKKAKVTPDEMLEKMNNGIEQEEPQKQQTQGQNPNKMTMEQLNDDKEKQPEQPENQFEPQDINNVFYFQEEDTKEKDVDQQKKTENKQQNRYQDNNQNSNGNSNRELHQDLNETPQLSIIYNDHMQSPNQPSKLLQNEIQAIQQAINQKTKTQIINVFSFDNNELHQEQKEKYSPSQLSKYQPNQKIQQEFANSYLDDADRFNEHNEVMKKSGQFINFEVDHRDFNEEEQLQVISFQKRQEFMNIQQPQSQRLQEIIQIQPQQPIYKKTQWDDMIVDDAPQPRPQPQTIKIQEEQQFYEDRIPEKVAPTPTPITPMKNSFFDAEEDYDDMKPSQGLKNKHKVHKKKPDIPLPKNEIQKQIMNIYQKKDKKQLPPRKKRYPDMPSQSKMTNEPRQVRYSVEETDFIQQKPTFNPIFSGEIKRDTTNRYNQSRASGQFLHDEQQPQKPSVRLRKSSFKKIGEMVIQQPQSSGRK